MNKIRIEKSINTSYKVVGFFPLLWLVLFVIFHFYVSSVFEFSPSYSHPEYSVYSENSLIINASKLLLGLWIFSIWCTVYFFPAILLINLILKFRTKIKMNYKLIIICFAGCLAMFLTWSLSSPLRDTFEWILD